MISYKELDMFSSMYEPMPTNMDEVLERIQATVNFIDERIGPVVELYESFWSELNSGLDDPQTAAEKLLRAESLAASLSFFYAVVSAERDEALYLLMQYSGQSTVQMKEREARAYCAALTRREEYLRTAVASLTSMAVSLRRHIDLIRATT